MNQSLSSHPKIIKTSANFSSIIKQDPRSVEDQNQVKEKLLNEAKKKHRDYLNWSLFSLVVFFPMFFLWFPALIYAIKCKRSYCKFDLQSASWYSRLSHFYNVICLILGIVFYLNALTIFPMFITRNIHYHILVIMIPTLFVFILHVLRILIINN